VASVFAERSAITVRTQPGSTALDVTPNARSERTSLQIGEMPAVATYLQLLDP
jgi:hypothetical protein